MNLPLKSQKITFENGETLYVNVRGQGEKILAVVHGAWCDHRCLSPLFPFLEDDFTIIGPDFRGQGQSTLNTRIDHIDLYVDDLAMVLNYLGIRKCSLIGWSLGCTIATRYAILNPDIVDHLFLIGPPALSGIPCFKQETLFSKEGGKEKSLLTSKEELYENEYIVSTIEAIETQNLEIARKNLLEDSFEPDHPPNPELLNDLADQILKTQNVIDVRWLCFKYNFLEHEKWGLKGDGSIKRLKAKLYIFYGNKDVCVPPFVIDEYEELLGDQVVVLRFDTAHGLHYIYPKEVSDKIKEIDLQKEC